jgi:hypothetical protein
MYWKNTSVCLYGIYLHLDLSYHCLPLCLITFQSPTTWLSCERCMSESAHGLCDQVCKQNMSGYLFQPEKGVTKASISFKFTRSVKHIWEQPGLRFPGISQYTSDSHNRLSSASPLGLISYKPCLDSKSQTPISIFFLFLNGLYVSSPTSLVYDAKCQTPISIFMSLLKVPCEKLGLRWSNNLFQLATSCVSWDLAALLVLTTMPESVC